ncbi:alpha/beta fold hydrolase [Cellulomonas soli]
MGDQVEESVDAAPVPVVLLHGITDDGTCWPGAVAHLRAAGDGRHVVTPSALWHGGRTGEGRTALTISALAADAAATIAATLTRPAVVVGHSMGGVTAQELALIAPELVASLVLVDPGWMQDDPADEGRAPAWLRGSPPSSRTRRRPGWRSGRGRTTRSGRTTSTRRGPHRRRRWTSRSPASLTCGASGTGLRRSPGWSTRASR